MKPFKLIQGIGSNISKFEDEITKAMENGYEFSSELIIKTITHDNKPTEILLFQPMTIEEHLDFEDNDLDYSNNDDQEEDDA